MSDNLTRAMQAAAQDLTPDVRKLTSGGIERGVRKRRVRRISQIAGAAAGVTAVFAVVAAVAPGSRTPASPAAGGGPDAAALVATTQAAAVGGPPKPAPSASTSTAPRSDSHRAAVPPKTAPSAPPVSGEDMAKWLKQEVAPLNFSDVSVLEKKGSQGPGGLYAVLKVGYPAGVGNVSVSLQADNWDNIGWGSPLPPYITIKNESDGSHVVIFNGPQWPGER